MHSATFLPLGLRQSTASFSFLFFQASAALLCSGSGGCVGGGAVSVHRCVCVRRVDRCASVMWMLRRAEPRGRELKVKDKLQGFWSVREHVNDLGAAIKTRNKATLGMITCLGFYKCCSSKSPHSLIKTILLLLACKWPNAYPIIVLHTHIPSTPPPTQ